MKTYQDEKNFVENFAKDAKESLKNGQNFEATVNNAIIVVSGMDNNNSSKVTMYTATVNGVEFSGSITALKKRLNVTYTKEYNRSSEASTKVVIKSNEELQATAEAAAKRVQDAINVIKQAAQRYGLSRADMLERIESVDALILESLKQRRDNEAKRREAAAARRAEEAAAKIEVAKIKLEKQLAKLQAKLARMQ